MNTPWRASVPTSCLHQHKANTPCLLYWKPMLLCQDASQSSEIVRGLKSPIKYHCHHQLLLPPSHGRSGLSLISDSLKHPKPQHIILLPSARRSHPGLPSFSSPCAFVGISLNTLQLLCSGLGSRSQLSELQTL